MNSTSAVETGNQAYVYETGKVEAGAKSSNTGKASKNYGKTVGEPKLSDEAQAYYEKLKKKYGNMDFILVSRDMKEQAKSQAAAFANPLKTVVLIDEDKIERMAVDDDYRKQYEGVISNAMTNMASMKTGLQSTGANIKGYGMSINDGGNASFFAVLEKSSAAQKERIEKKAKEKKAEKQENEKKARKQELEERLKNKALKDSGKVADTEDDSTVTITANSMEELIEKINSYAMEERSNMVETREEKMVGNYVDFRG